MIEVRSEIATVVMEYKVDEGDFVNACDIVMMTEVMKMQQYIEASADGKVHFVAQLGETVEAGAVLFTIEAN